MSLPTVPDTLTDASRTLLKSQANNEVIRFENVSVCFNLPNVKLRSFKGYIIARIRRGVRYRKLWALRNINLTVNRGEVMGIIGPNGAGKSTLLQVVSRILKPTEGRVWVRGQIAPLLGIGAGFHQELTGRENVFLNGTLLGFSRSEMEEKFERIVDFAELWDFIDAPLRTYSTGMRARLGFAVATDTKPDILIIDEVLSVGDEAFREKSTNRMREFFEGGTTILLVSHSMSTIQELCHKVAWIHKGNIQMLGNTKKVVKAYRKSGHTDRKKRN
jgi:ABC-type polysaccharide/polyol phosphate transport system ATPase subunit